MNADALQVAELLRAVNQQVPASGTLSLNGHVGGTISAPSANVTLNGNNLVAYQETWGSLVAGVASFTRLPSRLR